MSELEQAKLIIETDKLRAEAFKLWSEGLKMQRERWWHPIVVSAALLGAGAALGALLVKYAG